MFFGFCAAFYWQLEGTYLDECLQFYGIGMKTSAYSTIAVLQALVALPHALLTLKMISTSIYHWSFAFSFGPRAIQRRLRQHRRSRQSRLSISGRLPRMVVQTALKWPTWMAQAYHFLCDREGLFGVEGRYFHLILFVREFIETSLQTNQAYRMSFYLARMWLNRFYVTLLVLNCWLTPLIHFAYKKNEAKKRLLCLVCDCALDLTSSVLIPCTIIASYYSSYDSALAGFEMMMWYDDIWFVHIVNEFQILLVVSWQDLSARLVFSFGMIVAMSDIKELLVGISRSNLVSPLTPIAPTAAGTTIPAKLNLTSGPSTAELLAATANDGISQASFIGLQPAAKQQARPSTSTKLAPTKFSHRLVNAGHMLLILWGAVILGLHAYTESHLELSECLLQVRPWGKRQPACSLVLLNCYSSGITGSRSEINAEWGRFDAAMVVRALIRHCEALEMPPSLQTFSQLKSLKVYNTTVVDWGEEAAITASHLPHMTSLFILRVNFSGGELPFGLQSSDFPRTLSDIEFSMTNLHSLPSDLDAKWPQYLTLYLENSAFASVPEVALRMKPVYLSLYGNPISELPSALFEVGSIVYLHVGATLVTSLPTDVNFDPQSSSLSYWYVSNTAISNFPAWVNGVVTAGLKLVELPIYASGTPYCAQLESIYAGRTSKFNLSGEPTLGPVSVLMNASPANQDLLYQTVSCNPDYAGAFFPLEFEDEKSGLPAV